MPHLGLPISDELHASIKARAADQKLSIAEYVRQALHAQCMDSHMPRSEGSDLLRQTLDELHAQLQAKDTQISSLLEKLDQAQQLCAMRDRLLLEERQERRALAIESERTWLQRMIARFSHRPAESAHEGDDGLEP